MSFQLFPNLSLLRCAIYMIALVDLWIGLEQNALASCGDWLANHSVSNSTHTQAEAQTDGKTEHKAPPVHRPCNGPKCSQGQLPLAPQSPLTKLQIPDEATALALVADFSALPSNEWDVDSELMPGACYGTRLERPPRN